MLAGIVWAWRHSVVLITLGRSQALRTPFLFRRVRAGQFWISCTSRDCATLIPLTNELIPWTASMPRRVEDREYFDDFGTPSRHVSVAKWRAIAARLRIDDRQLNVIQGLIDGLSETSIGKRLNLSPSTIHTDVLAMYTKFNVHDRTSLVVRVFLTYIACEKQAKRKAAGSAK